MRLIAILIALTILGLLTAKALKQPAVKVPDVIKQSAQTGVPQVPTKLQQVPEFKKQMNQFMDKQQKQHAKRLNELPQ